MSEDKGRGERTVMVAGCQMPETRGDPASRLAMIQDTTATAVARGAELVCFPEAFVTGYARDRAAASDCAISLGSPAFDCVRRRLSASGAIVVVGLIERAGNDLFSSAVVIGPNRQIGVYRKRHPVENGFTPGQGMPIFKAGMLRFGVGICSDARVEDDSARLAARGINAILFPLNNMLPVAVADRWRHRHAHILRSRAREANVWVISADVVGRTTDQISYGCSIAINPAGEIVDQVDHQVSGIAVARVPVR